MQIIKVESGALSVGPGAALLLTKAQAEPRRHNLAKCEKVGDVFLAEARVVLQFKAGEVLGASEVAKAFVEKVRAVTPDDGEAASAMLAAAATLVPMASQPAPVSDKPAPKRR